MIKVRSLLILITISLLFNPNFLVAAEKTNYTFEVDCSAEIGNLDHFWNASGLAMDYTDSVQQQNMYLIGSVPHQGMLYQRPHDLLDLVTVKNMNSENPTYDWSEMDNFIDAIIKSGQKMFFEIMGNPSNHFSDFNDDNQLRQWKRLVKDLALHLEDRYGKQEVRSWYFETWNEPDGDYHWDWDKEEFYKYYDACSEGLKEADPQLKFGGPGVANRHSDYVFGLIEHCMEGESYFGSKFGVGVKGVRMDFISYHNKKWQPTQVERDIETTEKIISKYPQLIDKLFVNNESDVKCCWRDFDKPYRKDHWYASYVARQVTDHWHRLIHKMGINFRLANDNAFIGDWINRTNFKWFGDGEEFALIKQPVHNQMILMSLLGNSVCKTEGFDPEKNVGIFATKRNDNQLALMIYAHESDYKRQQNYNIILKLKNIPFKNSKIARYTIDSGHVNTYKLWTQMGSPAEPEDEHIEKLRNAQEIQPAEKIKDLDRTELTANIELPLHTVTFFCISKDPGKSPEKIKGLFSEVYPGLDDDDEDVLIFWEEGSRFIKTYEVLHSDSPDGPFKRINKPDLLCTSFIHSRDEDDTGYYRVRAVDFWNRKGPESKTIKVK